jgi:hypothetical protein
MIGLSNEAGAGALCGIRLPQSDLPPGIRDSDCEGGFDPLADASAHALWHACGQEQQEKIAERFVQLRAEDLRDVLLTAQESAQSAKPDSAAGLLGRELWPLWSRFRDESVEELHRRGKLRLEASGFVSEEAPCRNRP